MRNEVETHAHSYYSDGYDSPAELARKAKKKGLKAVCLTDHDAYQGLPEFSEECEKIGIDFLPGIELTSVYEGAVDVHILGYGIDFARKEILDGGLAKSWNMHEKRMELTLKKYAQAGIMDADMEDLSEMAERENYPYLTRGDLKKYRFVKFGVPYARTRVESNRGGPAGVGYVRDLLPSPEESVELIRKSGGRAVLAHPGNYLKKLRKDEVLDINIFYEILDKLIEAGLFGLEAGHVNHTAEENEFFEKLAKERGLFATRGADYHGVYAPARVLGENDMDYEDFLKLKAAVSES